MKNPLKVQKISKTIPAGGARSCGIGAKVYRSGPFGTPRQVTHSMEPGMKFSGSGTEGIKTKRLKKLM